MAFSAAVLYGELANFFNIEFSFFNVIISLEYGYFVTNLLVFIPFSYIIITTYFGLFSFKITKWYELYPKHTDSVSLIYSASFLARLIYPICFNFLKLAQIEKTQFSIAMSSLSEGTIFGEGINRFFFPICLILFFFMNLFNLYRWLLSLCGWS